MTGIRAGVHQRGFTDVRPASGFALGRIADGRTTTDLAEHLGMTKQATSGGPLGRPVTSG